MKRLLSFLVLSVFIVSLCEDTPPPIETETVSVNGFEADSQIPTQTIQTLEDLPKVRVTCYYQGTTTASGKRVREGYVAAAKEHIGDTCILYTLDHQFIGIFECEDTGGAYRIRKEGSVDVYRTSLSRCYDWVHEYGDYLLVQWIEDAEG